MKITPQITKTATELRQLLNTIDEAETVAESETPEDLARRLVWSGSTPDEAIAAATAHQSALLAAPVRAATAERRLGAVLLSLQGQLRDARDKALAEADKGLQRAFDKWCKANKGNFEPDAMETVFVATLQWREHVAKMDEAGQIPVLHKASFPYGWSCTRFEPVRAGKSGIRPHHYGGATGECFDGLLRLCDHLTT